MLDKNVAAERHGRGRRAPGGNRHESRGGRWRAVGTLLSRGELQSVREWCIICQVLQNLAITASRITDNSNQYFYKTYNYTQTLRIRLVLNVDYNMSIKTMMPNSCARGLLAGLLFAGCCTLAALSIVTVGPRLGLPTAVRFELRGGHPAGAERDVTSLPAAAATDGHHHTASARLRQLPSDAAACDRKFGGCGGDGGGEGRGAEAERVAVVILATLADRPYLAAALLSLHHVRCRGSCTVFVFHEVLCHLFGSPTACCIPRAIAMPFSDRQSGLCA